MTTKTPEPNYSEELNQHLADVPDRQSLYVSDLADEIEKAITDILVSIHHPSEAEDKDDDKEEFESTDAVDAYYTHGRVDFTTLDEELILAVVSVLTPTERFSLWEFYSGFDLLRLAPIKEALYSRLLLDKAAGNLHLTRD